MAESAFRQLDASEVLRFHVSGKPFESFPLLLTLTRDQQIAQLGFVPSRMEARLIPKCDYC